MATRRWVPKASFYQTAAAFDGYRASSPAMGLPDGESDPHPAELAAASGSTTLTLAPP